MRSFCKRTFTNIQTSDIASTQATEFFEVYPQERMRRKMFSNIASSFFRKKKYATFDVEAAEPEVYVRVEAASRRSENHGNHYAVGFEMYPVPLHN